MTARLIDGKAIAQGLRETIKTQVAALRAAGKRPPGLAVVLVGADAASQIYVRHKSQACEAAGMHSLVLLPGPPQAEVPASACAERRPRSTASCAALCPTDQFKVVIGHRGREGLMAGREPRLLAQRTPRLRPRTPRLHQDAGTRGHRSARHDAVVIKQSNIVGRRQLRLLTATVRPVQRHTAARSRAPRRPRGGRHRQAGNGQG
jgi:methylenetetrahydrofolate dehydrogenase (NADP+)/methenyltetrahydrofolate cyclohydrolase